MASLLQKFQSRLLGAAVFRGQTADDFQTRFSPLQILRVEIQLIRIAAQIFRAFLQLVQQRIDGERPAESGEALTADTLSAKYLALNKLYFGDTMISDDEIALEWTRIPHFYYNYYVFQYATSFSAAVAIANRILREGESAVKDYKKFLSGGCSKEPVELLRDMGVDMRTSAPVNDALSLFGELVDELSALLC